MENRPTPPDDGRAERPYNMTNRGKWELRIIQMSDEEFSKLMNQPDFQIEYGKQFCAWCKATKPGISCEDCLADDVEYLRATAID